jgi:TRAP-type C4-dicarboxylate transport system permease small subunit
MRNLHRIEKGLTLLIDVVITGFFAIILLLTILQVILRYGFNQALLGGNESMEGLFIYTTALGAATAIRRRQHISITYMVDKLPQGANKLADILAHLLVALINGVMIYYSLGWISKVGGHASPVMRVPEWLFQVSVPIGCSLVILYCLFNVALNLWNDQTAESGGWSC